MTLVMAAAQRMTPNTRRPTSPAAAWNALAAWFSSPRSVPAATTPRIARNSTTRMRPVTMMPVIDPRVMSRTCPGPLTPESSSRCAPA